MEPPNPVVEKDVPSQCVTCPEHANHTSVALEPQTASTLTLEVTPSTVDQVVPLKRRIVPPTPTAQTSDELAAHTPRRLLVVPLTCGIQMPLTRRRIVPASPTRSCAGSTASG